MSSLQHSSHGYYHLEQTSTPVWLMSVVMPAGGYQLWLALQRQSSQP